MTSSTRRAAGVLTLLEGLFAFYTLFENVQVSCPSNSCPLPQVSWPVNDVVMGLAVVLLVVGALGLWGASVAYPAGAVFSAILLLLMGYAAYLDSGYPYLSTLMYQGAVGGTFAAVGLVANVMGMRRSEGLSEQANPMNLPVFG